MPVSNSVPEIIIGPTGPVLPAESAILAGVQADINTAFGGGVNPDLRQPQGQIATSITAVIGDKNNQVTETLNMIDPELSVGRYQDALGRIYFLERLPALPTAVACTVTGATGTVIGVGAQAQALDGSIYICTGAVTIPGGGSISANFAAVVPGATPCPANTLNKIYLSIPGWDSINNAADGVIGRPVESASDFEYRRKQSVALNGVNSIQSISANVAAVPGVLDQYCIQNDLDTTVTIGAVTLAKHSIWVSVSGGAAADIAAAIWKKKTPGTNYNGATTYRIYDTRYAAPMPYYDVYWNTATPTPVKFAVQIVNSVSNPPGVVALVKAAIISAFAGGDGGPVARIASQLNAGRFYAPVTNAAPVGSTISVLSVLLGTSTPTLTSVLMAINQEPTLVASDISVTLV